VHGAGYRGVYDFADPDSSVFVIGDRAVGPSALRHYDDLGELWRRGEYIPMSLDPELARAAAVGITGSWRPPEVGFILHPDHWGRGYAFEAMSALIPILFARHAVPALTAEADPRNAASLALLERLGFRETGRAVRTMQWRDEWCDSVYLALPRPS
jgi:RimJ/RimL family protein N-acetyltransferase